MLVSCEKEVSVQDTTTTSIESHNARLASQEVLVNGSEIKTRRGIIVFASKEEYANAAKSLEANQSEKALLNFEAQIGASSFISMKTAFDNISEANMIKIGKTNSTEGYDGYVVIEGEGENKEAIRPVTGPVLATLVNKDGLLIVGNELRKYTYRNIFTIKDFTDKDIELFLKSVYEYNLESDPRVIAKTIKRKVVTTYFEEKPKSDSNARIASEQQCIMSYWHGDVFKRGVGKLIVESIDHSVEFDQLTGETYHQRRVMGIWWSDQAPENTVNMTWNVTTGYGPQSGTYNFTTYNDNRHIYSKSFWDGSNRLAFTINSFYGYPQIKGDDNGVRSCYLSM